MWYHHYHEGWFWGLGWGVMFLLLFPYFLPTIIAVLRRKNSAIGIFFLNLFLGWTFIGWIGALIWSLMSDRQPTIIVNNAAPPYSSPPPYSPPPPPTSHSYTNVTVRKPAATQQDKIDQVRQLKQLLDEGALTEAEFNRQKAEILG
jgi:hypothetical protein